MKSPTAKPKTYRTIFISDLHLGARESQAEKLLDFLKHNDSDQLFLLGDIFDGWALRRRWFWEQEYNDVIQKLLRRARKGCKITYIPGNHDHFVRAYEGLRLGGIVIKNRAVHTTVDGRRLLLIHGDEFDGVVTSAQWLARLGSVAYSGAVLINRWFNAGRRVLGLPYWSLSAWLKRQVKNAVMYVDRFEDLLADEARKNGVDGVVCGHIHHAAIRHLDDVTYYNTGDWVESCTALVEHVDGSMEILRWAETGSSRATARVEPMHPLLVSEGSRSPT